MKKTNPISSFRPFWMVCFLGLTIFVSSCQKDKTDDPGKSYPEGSIVWPKDTVITLRAHYIVPLNKKLFIEEGVNIIFDNIDIRPEFIVLGNLYCYGTAAHPIRFTVPESLRTEERRFERSWGGIICGYDSEEVLLEHTIIEYGGAQTTEESASFQNQLFKTETGEGVPAFHFCNTEGRVVIQNCIFRNNAEDHIYITGGKSIVAYNKFITNGFDGGEAVNYKSGCWADIAYNVMYDANTNALKLSNNGALEPQGHFICYNNTLVNCGWRRPKIKGGSIWLEINCRAELYNNLLFDCRHAVKHDVKNPEDPRSIITPTFAFSSTVRGLALNDTSTKDGQLMGALDKRSAVAGDNNPLFALYSMQALVDVEEGLTQSGHKPQMFQDAWDFRLLPGSPALIGGTTSFTRHFGTVGLRLEGGLEAKEYKSPAPHSYFGAFPAK